MLKFPTPWKRVVQHVYIKQQGANVLVKLLQCDQFQIKFCHFQFHDKKFHKLDDRCLRE